MSPPSPRRRIRRILGIWRAAPAAGALGAALLAAACGGDADEGRSPGREAGADADSGLVEEPAYVRYAVTRSSTDTVAVERILRSPGRLEAELRDRETGRRLIAHLEVTGEERVRSASLEPRAAGAASVRSSRTTWSFQDGSVSVERTVGDSVVTRERRAPEGTLPWVDGSVAFLEQLVRRSRAVGEGSGSAVTVPLLDLRLDGAAEERTLEARVEWASPDSVVVEVDERTLHVRVDGEGRIARARDGGRGTVAERIR